MSYIQPPVPCINVSSTTDQYADPINTPIAISYDSVDVFEGIDLVSSSRITLKSPGKYLITFSAVVDASQGNHTMNLWFRKNGITPIPNTNTNTSASANNPVVCTVTLIHEFAKDDYFEIMIQSSSSDARISHVAASGVIPASPSIILTCNKISV